MVTRNGLEPKTPWVTPRHLDHAPAQICPSVLGRAWCELFSILLEIPVEIFCTKLMFLLNFSSCFFEVNASTKLDFLTQTILLFLGDNKTKSNFNLHLLHLTFLGLEFFLWPSVNVQWTAHSAGASISSPFFYESLNFCDDTDRAAWLGTVQSCMHVL